MCPGRTERDAKRFGDAFRIFARNVRFAGRRIVAFLNMDTVGSDSSSATHGRRHSALRHEADADEAMGQGTRD